MLEYRFCKRLLDGPAGLQSDFFVGFWRGNLGERAIDDLVDGVDRFSFAGTAAKHENTRDEMEMSVARIVSTTNFVFLLADDSWDADRLTAMATEDTAEMLTDWFC
jgi:hypothetical protein